MMKNRGPTRKRRGIAVILAIFFMILLALISVTLIGLVPVELKSATRTKLDLQAHYAATAGIRRARTWCQAVMTPEPTNTASPDHLGDDNTTWGNTYCDYLNEVASVPDANGDFKATTLGNLLGEGLIPTGTANWGTGSTAVYKMLNIPQSGAGSVDSSTVVLVSESPITMGDWTVYTVIIPDADSPGGKNTIDGSSHVIRAFGGAGASGQRCYQVVCLAYYQGFPVVRAKSVFLESSFARYSLFVNQDPENTWYMTATAGQQSTEGPVHTNGFFRFFLDSNLWSDTSGRRPFNGLLTFASRPGAQAYTGMDYDGALYYQGNDLNGQDQERRPFGGGDETARYETMIQGGRGNLRQTASPISLPQNTSKISQAAYGGTTFSTSMYTDSALAGHLDNTGIYVMGKDGSPSQVGGGVVVKGDQQRMFLEAVNTDGLPYGNFNNAESSSLANGSASLMNPGIRVQASSAVTKELYSTSTFTTSTSCGTTSTFDSMSTYNASRSTGRVPTNTVTNYCTTVEVSGSWSTWTTGGGGAGGVVQTTSSFVPTFTTTRTTATRYTTQYSTQWSTYQTSRSIFTGRSALFSPPFESSSLVVTASASWKPVDTVIETKKSAITLSPASFDSAPDRRFTQAAGRQGTNSNMETYRIDNNGSVTQGIEGYTQFLVKNGTQSLATLTTGSTTIPTDKVVVIKQSREDPQTAVVFIMDRGDGDPSRGDPVLNGAVFTEGDVGGIAGVNLQRKTIAGQVQDTSASNSADPLGPQPAKPSSTLSIIDNVWQFGTNPKNASDPNTANKPAGADDGLGIVAEWININAKPSQFSSYSGGDLTSNNQILTVYATMLAGRKNGSTMTGGLTVGVNGGGATSINDLSRWKMGWSNNTPLLRTVGGLIVANYYARINLINGAGWNSANIYDQQLALKPPPFFPNDGGLNPLTYVEERIWGNQKFGP